MTELEPCPFCGGKATIADYDIYWSIIASGNEPNVSCGCRLFMESELFAKNDILAKQRAKEKLIERWNHRSSPWHTGKPTENGWYLLECKIGNSKDTYFTTDHWDDTVGYWTVNRVIRWQKIDENKEDPNVH